MMQDQIAYRKECLEKRRQMRRSPDRPITSYYLDAEWAHRDELPVMREAQGSLALLGGMELELWPEERFCGTIKPREVAGFHYSTWVNAALAEMTVQQDPDPELMRKCMHALERVCAEPERFDLSESSAMVFRFVAALLADSLGDERAPRLLRESVSGAERLALPADFDGSVFAINERRFSPKAVTVSLPSRTARLRPQTTAITHPSQNV